MRTIKNILLILFATVIFVSCKKEESAEINPVPVIEYLTVNDTIITQFQDSILVTFSYKDGDGDIGETDPDTYSLTVKDSRLENPDWYHIPPLTPNGEALNISGTLTVRLNTLFLLGNGGDEYTTLTIQLIDRAGNRSNEIFTPELTITE